MTPIREAQETYLASCPFVLKHLRMCNYYTRLPNKRIRNTEKEQEEDSINNNLNKLYHLNLLDKQRKL